MVLSLGTASQALIPGSSIGNSEGVVATPFLRLLKAQQSFCNHSDLLG